MVVREKAIKETIDLSEIPSIGSQVVGISTLNPLANIRKGDVLNSRGEFAGCFYENGHVILFRDRLGARNIFYSIQDGTVTLSTNLGWVARQVSTEPNWSYILSDYLQFQIPFADETFFAGVRKVMPGEFVIINSEGRVERERYWDIEFGDRPFRSEELAELIRDAVQFRLSFIGDRSYTAYLSGGLDSSAITLLAEPEQCFAGFYAEEGYSEMDYIEAVIQQKEDSLEYTPIRITQDAFQSLLSALPEILPDPCGGLGVIPQVLVAQEAKRKGYHFAFTGEGGDEIFLGYNWNTMVFSLANAARALLRDRYMVRYEPMVDKVLRDGLPTLTGGLLARGDDMLYATERILELWDRDQPVENNILGINLKLGLPAILTLDEQVGRYAGIETCRRGRICGKQSCQRAPSPLAGGSPRY